MNRGAQRRVNVRWSAEDGEYVARTPDFPSLSVLSTSEEDAARQLHALIDEVEADIASEQGVGG